MTEECATFRAAFPTIQSAIKIYGDKQGMRVQLDIPESEMAEAVKLLAWRERVLVITIGPELGGHTYLTDLDNATEEGTEGSNAKVGRRRVAIRRDKRAGR